MSDFLIVNKGLKLKRTITDKIKGFLREFKPHEIREGAKLILFYDEKSGAYYIVCHLEGSILSRHCDIEAGLEDNEEDVIYKLNRDITEDQAAYKAMEADAYDGRSFEDMVIEYNTSYRPNKPLKVYGGQHRIRAIEKASKQKGSVLHGIRVYFDLTEEQKVEIATVNNTSIAVPNDLLDRMREQLLGSELRSWCQHVNLLMKDEDFADRKSPDAPTVRIARTLLVNFYRGLSAKDTDFHQPMICKSGGLDEDYIAIRKDIDWTDDRLIEMGKQFARLHKVQRDAVLNRTKDKIGEYARKTLSLSVVASWAYAAGYFQRNPEYLAIHYDIPSTVSAPDDPLNAKALSEARLKGTDPDTYRGLGTRSSPRELGRMLEVFIVLATKATKKRITKDLANAAIQSYEAKRSVNKADKVLGKI